MVFRSQSARSLNLIWWKLLNFCLCFLSCRMGIYRVVRIKSGHSLAYLEPCNSIIAIITYTNANMYITFEIYKRYMELCLMQCSLAFFPALQFNLLHIEYWLILNFNMLQINIFSYTSSLCGPKEDIIYKQMKLLELLKLLSNYNPILKEHSIKIKQIIPSKGKIISYSSQKIIFWKITSKK